MNKRDWIRFVTLTAVLAVMMFSDQMCRSDSAADIPVWDWLWMALGSVVLSLSLTAFALVLPGKVSRIIYPVFYGWSFFVCAVQLFCRVCFGFDFGSEIWSILMGSSLPEFVDFIRMRSTPAGIAGVLLAVSLCGVTVWCAWKCSAYEIPKKSALFISAAVFPCAVSMTGALSVLASSNPGASIEDSTCLGFAPVGLVRRIADEVDSINGLEDASLHPAMPEAVTGPKKADDVLGVFVIGESMTRNHMSLYGYGRETTPRLDAMSDRLFVFRDLVAPWSRTTKVLRLLLTEAKVDSSSDVKYTLPAICSRGGYSCALYSNQDHWGEDDGVDTLLFMDCARKVWLGDAMARPGRYDDKLLPYARSEMTQPGNRAVFLHLMGSHIDTADRYPPGMAVFGRGQEADEISKLDHYDNSVAFTDHLLGELIESLSYCRRPAFLIYISDHGETPDSPDWRDMTDIDLWEIPMFVWVSPEYAERYPDTVKAVREALDRPLQSDQLLHGIVDLFQIEPLPGWTPDEDFLSSEFRPREVRRKSNGRPIYTN